MVIEVYIGVDDAEKLADGDRMSFEPVEQDGHTVVIDSTLDPDVSCDPEYKIAPFGQAEEDAKSASESNTEALGVVETDSGFFAVVFEDDATTRFATLKPSSTEQARIEEMLDNQ